MPRLILVLVLSGLAWTTASCLPGQAASSSASDWQTYESPRFGFSISIPGSIFVADTESTATGGQIWISRDGQARILASAGANETGETPSSYRAFVLQNSYAGAKITYAPLRSRWFVLSGIKDDKMFYERITFACGGRFIYGWQIIYPLDQRHIYDPIIEEIHKGYRPGNRDTGTCPQPIP